MSREQCKGAGQTDPVQTLVSLAFVSSVRGLPPKKDSVVASAEARLQYALSLC